ncbi:DNA-binding protein [Herminiimonas contaminans]|uniref:DNA-binding protein n=1 Tax=Herminiimonas contaminans TaxID=1111140 RepID=A0ABS0EY69_9BURK|nr:DNA-binding protein [Herminiimonas contaminans]MBF8179782.1 DNA-binding protein [Herminiimonas contaminans]
MARTGLYKSQVKKARDTLIGQGKHPSVDAVRIELGNTGSKTTIHKYLKELEEEDGGKSIKASLSDALQDLVARLAAQLQEEADTRIAAIHNESAETERRQTALILELRQESTELNTSLQQAKSALTSEKESHEHTATQLQQAKVECQGLTLQVSALKERLDENERHRQSLEEKHQHARESLEHYRESTKEQRDQDMRRHEQQVQGLQAEMRQLQQGLIVKQDETTRLNKEGVRLVSDLSHAQQALYEQQTRVRQFEQKLEQLQSVDQSNRLLKEQIGEKDAQLREMRTQLADAVQQVSVVTGQLNQHQIELVTLQAKLDTHQMLSSELKSYLDRDTKRD